jgi:hypothetical protein
VGLGPRLLTGFCFDPESDPRQPAVRVSRGHDGFADVPDWTATISELSEPYLARVRDVVIHLPRSVRGHLTNQANPVVGGKKKRGRRFRRPLSIRWS